MFLCSNRIQVILFLKPKSILIHSRDLSCGTHLASGRRRRFDDDTSAYAHHQRACCAPCAQTCSTESIGSGIHPCCTAAGLSQWPGTRAPWPRYVVLPPGRRDLLSAAVHPFLRGGACVAGPLSCSFCLFDCARGVGEGSTRSPRTLCCSHSAVCTLSPPPEAEGVRATGDRE